MTLDLYTSLSYEKKKPASLIVNKRLPYLLDFIEFFAIQAQRLVEGGVYFKITFS